MFQNNMDLKQLSHSDSTESTDGSAPGSDLTAMSSEEIECRSQQFFWQRGSMRATEDDEDDLYMLQSRFKSLHFFDSRTRRLERAPTSASFSIASVREQEGKCDDDGIMWRFCYRRLGDSAPHSALPRYNKVPLQEYKQLDADERVMNFRCTQRREVTTDSVPENRRTSVIIRGIPKEYSRDGIISLLHTYGFARDINFIYVPLNIKSGRNTGYCFLNFRFPQDATDFMHFANEKCAFKLYNAKQGKEVEASVAWRYPVQGLVSILDRYRYCSTSVRSLPPKWRPTLIKDGLEVPQFIFEQHHYTCGKQIGS